MRRVGDGWVAVRCVGDKMARLVDGCLSVRFRGQACSRACGARVEKGCYVPQRPDLEQEKCTKWCCFCRRFEQSMPDLEPSRGGVERSSCLEPIDVVGTLCANDIDETLTLGRLPSTMSRPSMSAMARPQQRSYAWNRAPLPRPELEFSSPVRFNAGRLQNVLDAVLGSCPDAPESLQRGTGVAKFLCRTFPS